jgi:cytochrome c-type biogenesis protein CcmH
VRTGLWAAAVVLAAAAVAGAQTADPRQVVGPPKGPALADPVLTQRTEDVSALLRCPVCQGLSVADSPSTMAQNMKARTRELLAAGYDQEQILAYFEGSYGEFVRLKPPLRGINWVVWLGPLAGLGAGGLLLGWALRRAARTARPAADVPAEPPTAGTLPDDPALAPYVLRVREMAYGWPGGVPPRPVEAPAAAAEPPPEGVPATPPETR